MIQRTRINKASVITANLKNGVQFVANAKTIRMARRITKKRFPFMLHYSFVCAIIINKAKPLSGGGLFALRCLRTLMR